MAYILTDTHESAYFFCYITRKSAIIGVEVYMFPEVWAK